MTQFSNDLKVALEAARAAARVIKKNFGKSKDSRVKGDSKGLVTATDLEADRVILDILSTHSPHEIISEESGSSHKKSGPKWVIDPLDGTNNYARSLPLFAVSIGLMDGNESLVGVIIDPINKKEYYATKGGGAFCNGEKLTLPTFDTEYIPMLFLNHGYAETDREKFKILVKPKRIILFKWNIFVYVFVCENKKDLQVKFCKSLYNRVENSGIEPLTF